MKVEDDLHCPIVTTILGVPVVTIPLADYCMLLDYQRQFQEALGRQAISDDGEATLVCP